MNCKPGDLAVLIRSRAGNEGKIVRCVRLATSVEVMRENLSRAFGPIWLLDGPIIHTDGRAKPYAKDAWLRPIRPQPDDAQDETLTWVSVPKNDEVSA